MKRYWSAKWPYDPENEIEATATDDAALIAVSEEHAMDSHNQTFSCTYRLSRDQARELAAWLTSWANDEPLDP